MYRIAVCDNDPQDLRVVEQLAQRWLELQNGLQGSVTCFGSSVEMAEQLRGGRHFALYLLDILMPGISGIELGRAVREGDREAAIIYMTTSEEYALQAYGVTALRYFKKPVEWPAMQEALDAAYALFSARPRRMVLLQSQGSVRQVQLEDILYVENDTRSMVYYLRDGTEVRCSHRDHSFEEAMSPLMEQGGQFVQSHKSFFVNMGSIRELRGDSICLDNGAVIPITRKRLAEVREAYLEFASREGSMT